MPEFAHIKLNGPVTVASGPLTAHFRSIQEAEEQGAGACSLKLTFVKVPFPSEMRSYSVPSNVILSPTNRRLDMDEGTALMKKIKKELSIPMFANIGALGSTTSEWTVLSRSLEKAGSDAMELNFCCPNLETSEHNGSAGSRRGASIAEDPDACYDITQRVRKEIDIPIVCKILPGDAVLTETARACEQGGADGIHVVGQPTAGLPPLDERGDPVMPLIRGIPPGSSNGSVCKYSTFLSTAKTAQSVDIPVMASGGLETWKDCIDLVRWGGTAPSVCSAVMWRGYGVIQEINRGISDYMDLNGYADLDSIRGSALSHLTTPDKTDILEGHAVVNAEMCIGCGKCTRIGHCTAITLKEGKAEVDGTECIGCGVCWSVCPAGAISYEEEDQHAE